MGLFGWRQDRKKWRTGCFERLPKFAVSMIKFIKLQCVFGERSGVGHMKRRLILASSGNLAKNTQNERKIWDCLGGGRIEKSGGPVVSRDYQSLR